MPLLEQHRGRWDQLLIRRGYAALLRAERLRRPVGPYVLQAAIAACHAQARTAEETDWARIAALYDNLLRLTPTPVVELNRAVAVAMAYGPDEAWGSWSDSPPSRHCAPTTCCRRSGATCSPGSGAPNRPRRSTTGPPSSPRTPGSGTCYATARPPFDPTKIPVIMM